MSLAYDLIEYEMEMKAMHGPDYPSWREEARIRIEQINKWLERDDIPILGKLHFLQEKIDLLEALASVENN